MFFPFLQVSNGAQHLDTAYTSHTSVESMEEAIFDTVFEEVRKDIQEAPCVGVMLDETTDLSVKKKLIVCVRIINNEGVPKNYMIANKVIAAGDASTILSKLEEILKIYGIDLVQVVSLGTDGASVMVGKKNGLGVKLKEAGSKFLIQTHCAAHRLNLASSDAAKTTEYLKDYNRLITSLHSFYVHSSNKYDNLHELQQMLHGEITQLHTPTAVRWLSLEATVVAILKCWPAIVLSLESEASTNAKAKGLLNKIKTCKFLLVTALLSDVLVALGLLSRKLQKHDLDISDMYLALETTLESLKDMQLSEKNCINMSSYRSQMKPTGDGKKLLYEHYHAQAQDPQAQVQASIKIEMSDVSSGSSQVESLRRDYIGKIILNIKQRFHMVSIDDDVDDSLSDEPPADLDGGSGLEELMELGDEVAVDEEVVTENDGEPNALQNTTKYASDLSDFELLKVMDRLFNPKHLHNSTREELAEHGIEELNILLHKYDGMKQFFGSKKVLDAKETNVNFSNFKHTLKSLRVKSGKTKSKNGTECTPSMNEAGRLMFKHQDTYPNIMTIMVICMTQVVTSVMCEQEFSKQNWIKSKTRNRLSPERVERQMFIKTNAPDAITEVNWAKTVAVFNEAKIRRKPFRCF